MDAASDIAEFLTTRRAKVARIDGLDTGRRGGPAPDEITLETVGREIPEA